MKLGKAKTGKGGGGGRGLGAEQGGRREEGTLARHKSAQRIQRRKTGGYLERRELEQVTQDRQEAAVNWARSALLVRLALAEKAKREKQEKGMERLGRIG